MVLAATTQAWAGLLWLFFVWFCSVSRAVDDGSAIDVDDDSVTISDVELDQILEQFLRDNSGLDAGVLSWLTVPDLYSSNADALPSSTITSPASQEKDLNVEIESGLLGKRTSASSPHIDAPAPKRLAPVPKRLRDSTTDGLDETTYPTFRDVPGSVDTMSSERLFASLSDGETSPLDQVTHDNEHAHSMSHRGAPKMSLHTGQTDENEIRRRRFREVNSHPGGGGNVKQHAGTISVAPPNSVLTDHSLSTWKESEPSPESSLHTSETPETTLATTESARKLPRLQPKVSIAPQAGLHGLPSRNYTPGGPYSDGRIDAVQLWSDLCFSVAMNNVVVAHNILFGAISNGITFNLDSLISRATNAPDRTMMKLLLRYGANARIYVQMTGHSLLHDAVLMRDGEYVQILLQQGLSTENRQYLGLTPLEVAEMIKCPYIASDLRAYGAIG